MTVKLLPMPASEWHLYLKVCASAFMPGMMSAMYPNGLSEQDIQHSVASMKRLNERHPGRIHVFKAVDDSLPANDPYERIVGVSQWKLYPKQRSEEEMKKEEEEGEQDEKEYGVPEGMNRDCVESFHNVCAEYKRRHLGREPYILLQVLATRPDQHRKGVGSLAMQWGCDKADEFGLPAYLEGSVMGVGLYKKWGFEIVDELAWEARDFGYKEPLPHMCMKRQPRRRE